MNPIRSLRPDIHAQAVARSVYRAIQPENVILFGSRARGDHTADSDIDLLILTEGPEVYPETQFREMWACAQTAARDSMQRHYRRLAPVDLVFMPLVRFQYLRTARYQVPYNALREGIAVNELHWRTLQNTMPNQDPSASSHDNWPAIQQHCRVAYRHLQSMYNELHGIFKVDESIGFFAQQALENTLKGWLLALNLSVPKQHDLDVLVQILEKELETVEIEGVANKTFGWLTAYAVNYRYGDVILALEDPDNLYQQTLRLVDAMVDEIAKILNYHLKTDPRVASFHDALRRTLQ